MNLFIFVVHNISLRFIVNLYMPFRRMIDWCYDTDENGWKINFDELQISMTPLVPNYRSFWYF